MSERAQARSPLVALLGPTSVADFAAEVWSRDLLMRRARDGADLTDLFSLDDADELLGSRALRTPFLRIAKDGVVAPSSTFTRSGGVGATVSDQVDAERVAALLVDGSTVVFQGLHRAWPRVQQFAADLAVELGHPVQANGYLTPSSARGFAAHYDTHDVFVVQLAGSKHWTIHSPAVDVDAGLAEWTRHRAEVAAAAATAPAFDGPLTPGDVLYLPRGWIHSAMAGAQTSLHLTLGIHPYTQRDVLDELIADAVAGLRVNGSLPLGIDIADPDELSSAIQEVRTALSDALIRTKDGDVAERMSHRRGRDMRAAPIRPVAQADAVSSLDGDSPTDIILRSGVRPRIEESDAGMTVRADGVERTFAADHAAALRLILTGAQAQSTDLPGLDDAAGRLLVRELLVAGIVVPVPQ